MTEPDVARAGLAGGADMGARAGAEEREEAGATNAKLDEGILTGLTPLDP